MINKENIASVEKNYNIYGDFVSYKTTYNTDKICFVPLDTSNIDYQAIQEWIAEGGVVIDNGGND